MTLASPHPSARLRRLTARVATLSLCASALLVRPAHAQSAQPYSIQLAVLFTSFDAAAGSVGGVGVEPQFRLNRLLTGESFGAVSLGIGGQYTQHQSGGQKITISGAFLEPRWIPPVQLKQLRPYLSARLSVLQQSSNFGTSSGGSGFGAGGGIALRLTKTTNLDAGLQFVRQSFGSTRTQSGNVRPFQPFTTYAAKVGVSLGFPER